MDTQIQAKWLTTEQGHIYCGLSCRTLEEHCRAGHIRSSNVVAPGASRGRRLILRESLDAFIEAGLTRPPSTIVMNQNRKLKQTAK